MNILSIQSSVAYGHVGNSAAVFPLQRLGFDVWPVITVHFSNHTGYGAWRGPVLPADAIRDVISGIDERGVFPTCDAVLSGYMGDPSLGEAIFDAANRIKAANAKALYCCDPVMGDVGRGFFVRPGIPEFMRDRTVPYADMITPNQFELEYLTGHTVMTMGDALGAVDAARAMGPRIVLLTSLVRQDSADDQRIEMLAVDDEGAWLVGTPHLPLSVNGAGDATAALFLGHYLKSGSIATALSKVASSIFAVLEETHRTGSREIRLVASQDVLADPPDRFPVERIR